MSLMLNIFETLFIAFLHSSKSKIQNFFLFISAVNKKITLSIYFKQIFAIVKAFIDVCKRE